MVVSRKLKVYGTPPLRNGHMLRKDKSAGACCLCYLRGWHSPKERDPPSPAKRERILGHGSQIGGRGHARPVRMLYTGPKLRPCQSLRRDRLTVRPVRAKVECLSSVSDDFMNAPAGGCLVVRSCVRRRPQVLGGCAAHASVVLPVQGLRSRPFYRRRVSVAECVPRPARLRPNGQRDPALHVLA